MLKPICVRAVRILTCLIALAVAVPALAQNAPPPAAKAKKLLMWRATSPTAIVYLLGSIHVGDASMYPMPAVVETAFAGSKEPAGGGQIQNPGPTQGPGTPPDYSSVIPGRCACR